MTEQQEQIKFVNWCKLNKIFVFSIPNGGTRNKVEATNMKREGLLKGATDLIVMLNVIVFIEFKVAPKVLKNGKLSYSNSKTSDEQIKFMNRVDTFDYAESFIAYGYDDAIKNIMEYL